MQDATIYSLRQATDADYDFLYRLHVITLREYIESLWGWEESWQQEYFARKFEPHKRKIIQIDGQDAGVVVIEQREQELYLGLLELLPAYQRRGVGTTIISQLIDRVGKQDQALSLHVLKSNHPARRLYERLGFVVVEDEEYRFKMTYQTPEGAEDDLQDDY